LKKNKVSSSAHLNDHLEVTHLRILVHIAAQYLYEYHWDICSNFSCATTTTTTVLWPFLWDYPGEPIPE